MSVHAHRTVTGFFLFWFWFCFGPWTVFFFLRHVFCDGVFCWLFFRGRPAACERRNDARYVAWSRIGRLAALSARCGPATSTATLRYCRNGSLCQNIASTLYVDHIASRRARPHIFSADLRFAVAFGTRNRKFSTPNRIKYAVCGLRSAFGTVLISVFSSIPTPVSLVSRLH